MTMPLNARQQHDPMDERSLLLSRLADGEASAADIARFEQLAQNDPALHRDLEELQRAMRTLAAELAEEVAAADSVEWPESSRPLTFAGWGWAISGWAAAIAVAVLWVFATKFAPTQGNLHHTRPAGDSMVNMTYDQLRRAYLTAPFVLDELDPIVLEVEELSDGRIAVRFMRRIEEIMFVEPNEPLTIDDEGALQQDPSIFRNRDGETWSPG